MSEFRRCLLLDLADAIRRHIEPFRALLDTVGEAVAKSVAELENVPLQIGQRRQDFVDSLPDLFADPLRGSPTSLLRFSCSRIDPQSSMHSPQMYTGPDPP
jgi:hypothetical protein